MLGSQFGEQLRNQPGASAEHFDLPAEWQIGNDFRGCGPVALKLWLGKLLDGIVCGLEY